MTINNDNPTLIPKVTSPTKETLRYFFSNKTGLVGFIILAIIIVFIIAGRFVDQDPFDIVWIPHTPPGEEGYLLGTDYLGRDILVGMLIGGYPTLLFGAFAALITTFIGVTLGAIAGFVGGIVDEFINKIIEFFQVLPALLFAMVILTLFSPSQFVLAITIGCVIWTQTARLARAEFYKIREMEYVTAARSIGSGKLRIIFKVILPNSLPPLIIAAAQSIGIAILFEAALSFLGLGDPNIMTWGNMIGLNRQYILDAWWPVTFPGIAIFLTVFAVSLIGDGINDAVNPRLRKR